MLINSYIVLISTLVQLPSPIGKDKELQGLLVAYMQGNRIVSKVIRRLDGETRCPCEHSEPPIKCDLPYY